jgi:hypothetical protein
VRDIEAGEELTCDYGMLNLLSDSFVCACEKAGCRGRVGDDWTLMTDVWDARVRAALPALTRVAQPLEGFVDKLSEIHAASRGTGPVPSCAVHRWRPPG